LSLQQLYLPQPADLPLLWLLAPLFEIFFSVSRVQHEPSTYFFLLSLLHGRCFQPRFGKVALGVPSIEITNNPPD
jgi:hypothetical protein